MTVEKFELVAGDRVGLLRIARSRQTPRGVAVRAQIVVDCADHGVAEAARRSSVSQATAAKWWKRYRAGGVAALDDNARSGRPPASDDTVRRVLSCTLEEPPPGADRWATRDVAEVTGVSQATVSRIRRRVFPAAAPAGCLFRDRPTSVLSYVGVHPTGCVLGFQASSSVSAVGEPAGAAHIDVIETILCATLLRPPLPGRPAGGCGAAVDLLRRAAGSLPSTPAVTLVVDVELDEEARQWLADHQWITAHSVPVDAWLGMMHEIADAVDPRQIAELREVQRRIRAVRRAGADEFVWSRAVGQPSVAIPDPRAAVELPAGDLAQVVGGICAAVADGRLEAGGTIAVRHIAGRSGLSPGRVADTLAQMAEEALIERVDGHYLLPAPTPRDVIETYTARGLLGTAVVRRLASAGIDLPPAVDEHYAGLVRCDEHGLICEGHRIDLDFQNELARSCQMPRIGSMFVRLSLQVSLFIAIFGLRYRYPTDEMMSDAQRILLEIRRHDPEAAVDAWRTKVDNCARYMLGQLPAE